jgi:hypothetical protein
MGTYVLLFLVISAFAVDSFFELRRDAKQSLQRRSPTSLKDADGEDD